MTTSTRGNTSEKTLLVFNCHEPWVYQLGTLGYALDIVVALRGRYHEGWDERMRPLPAHARLIPLPEALRSPKNYYCIVTHNMTDLLDVRARPNRASSCYTTRSTAACRKSSLTPIPNE